MLLDGKLIDSQTNEWHDVVNPATQQVLAQVPFSTDAEIEAAVASAKKAFKTWKNTPIAARARIMLKLQALVREHMSRIARTLSAEQGKTLADAEGDVFRGLEVVEHACSIGSLQLGEFAENVAGGVDTYTLRQPIGVVVGISPFNFPAMIPLWMFPMAIVCGNTFVLKPSEQDPMTPMLLAELVSRRACRPGCSTSFTAASAPSMPSARIRTWPPSPSWDRPRWARTSTTSPRSTASACNA
jgi:malonate-semialdehyde dehydrogenase (acetylating)/methylmalonate-semialdehyde dehydrogenase